MFARQLNQIRIDLSITPRGPLLIRSGRTGADPTRPELEWVRTAWSGRPSVYLPGSSLKGVMRSHAERLLLSEEVAVTPTFERGENNFKQDTPGWETYSGSSPLGRTFGNLYLKGHVAVADHYPGAHDEEGSAERTAEIDRANAVESRNGVAIDRLTGAARGSALFDREVVVQGRFDGRIVLRNVQLYQLVLLLLVIRDLDEGYVQLGSGTSRGNGFVAAEIRQVVLETRRGLTDAGKLAGIGGLGRDLARYELFDGDEVDLPSDLRPAPRLVWDRLVVEGERLDPFAELLVAGPWTTFLEKARGRRWSA